jgi:hypothetical protein
MTVESFFLFWFYLALRGFFVDDLPIASSAAMDDTFVELRSRGYVFWIIGVEASFDSRCVTDP